MPRNRTFLSLSLPELYLLREALQSDLTRLRRGRKTNPMFCQEEQFRMALLHHLQKIIEEDTGK